MMRFVLLAILPLAVQGFLPSSLAPGLSTSARLRLGGPLSPAVRVAPVLRSTRAGVIATKAVEYTVVKGEELKDGTGNKYTFTVTVDGAMSKDSYSECYAEFSLQYASLHDSCRACVLFCDQR